MQVYNKYIQEYLQTVCSQIKFKSAHKGITNELIDHIEEQRIEYIKQGYDEEAATAKALEQMGNPVLVGRQLDKVHRPRTEWFILSLALVLVVIGGAVQYFLSRVSIYNSYVFSHFLIYAPIGIAAFIFIYFFDYTLLGRYSKPVYFTLFTVTIIGFVVSGRVYGAYTHVYYLVMLFVPVFAGIIYGFRNKGYIGIIYSGLFYGGVAFLCIISHKLSGFTLFTISCLLVLTVAIKKGFFGGSKKVGLAIVYIPTAVVVLISMLFLLLSPYSRAKLSIIINPELDPLGLGYQHLMVKRLLSASKLFGEAALDSSFANMRVDQFLPGWTMDFSLTYIIVRLGLVIGLTIVAVIFALIVHMFILTIKQKNAFGFLVSFAACVAIAGQFILYVLSNLGVITLFAGTLPLVSFGGMGFIVNMILIGIVLSVYRRTDIVNDKLQSNTHGRRLFTLEDGKLIVDLGIKSTKSTG